MNLRGPVMMSTSYTLLVHHIDTQLISAQKKKKTTNVHLTQKDRRRKYSALVSVYYTEQGKRYIRMRKTPLVFHFHKETITVPC